jgi:hypothetical protein
MRGISLLALVGIFLLGACDTAQEITAPEEPEILEPLHHPVLPGSGPDGDYSMYYFDLNLFKNLVVKVGQTWTPTGTWPVNQDDGKCPGTSGGHTEEDYVSGPPAGPWPAANGFGFFSFRKFFRTQSGSMVVTHACWFDEWNGEGFPESAWVGGHVWPGGTAFQLKLESGGFPAPELGMHDHSLDKAVLYLNGRKVMSYIGELHHENGLSLIR